MLRTKSVHSPIDCKLDGLRILAARFRGRGLPADRYHVWMPNLGPSEDLLRVFQSGAITWRDFKHRYKQEILQNAPVDAHNGSIKNHGQKFTLRLLKELARTGEVTLMCHCAEHEQHCHRHLLEQLIRRT